MLTFSKYFLNVYRDLSDLAEQQRPYMNVTVGLKNGFFAPDDSLEKRESSTVEALKSFTRDSRHNDNVAFGSEVTEIE